jgi:hypothetical protein
MAKLKDYPRITVEFVSRNAIVVLMTISIAMILFMVSD